MKNKIIAIVILIIILVAGIYVDRFFNSNEALAPTEIEDIGGEPNQTLDVKHQYKDGNHIFVGTILIPSPCHSFNAFIENPDEGGIKYLKVEIKDPEVGRVCAQVVTEKTFRVVYPGAEDTEFKTYVNDEEFRLNIFEIPEYVDIDQFELYLKG